MLLKTKRKYIKPDIIIEEICDEILLLTDSEGVKVDADQPVITPGSEGDSEAKHNHHLEFNFIDIDE